MMFKSCMQLQGLKVTTSILVKQTKSPNTLYNWASKQLKSPLNETKTINSHFPITFYTRKQN